MDISALCYPLELPAFDNGVDVTSIFLLNSDKVRLSWVTSDIADI